MKAINRKVYESVNEYIYRWNGKVSRAVDTKIKMDILTNINYTIEESNMSSFRAINRAIKLKLNSKDLH